MVVNFFNQKNLLLKRAALLAVALLVAANFILTGVALAKSFKITDKEVELIKNSLNIFKIFSNVAVTDDKLKAFFNTTIKIGKTSTDITYGLFVLSAMNEMELIDMVVSQRYKTKAREYFNSAIDDRTNLLSYWKDVGFDLPRVLSGNITGPMSALSLNTFNTTSDIISIFTAFNVLKEERKYDGLWFYFDQRRNHTSHAEAWSDAKDVMGFAVVSNPLRFGEQQLNEDHNRLALQFAALWDKWGQYITPYGLAESAKEQVKNELTDTLALAIESRQFAEQKNEPSVIKKSWNNLIGKLKNIEDSIANVGFQIKNAAQGALDQIKSAISRINLFSPASLIQKEDQIPELPKTENSPKEELIDVKDQLVQPEIATPALRAAPKSTLEEMQETIDDISEKIDTLNREVITLSKIENNTNTEQIDEPAIEKEKESEKLKINEKNEIALCGKTGSAARNKIIFNEIAWMGGENSANDEWIELKNISGSSIDLTGWQVLDKDNQIKVVFAREVIPSNGMYLLERTSDDSAPGVTANLIYTGVLNNTNEAMYLFNENCGLMDEVIAESNWPAGDSSSRRTMERKLDFSWQTSATAGGTPKRENSAGYEDYSRILSGGNSSGGGGSAGGSATPPPPSPPPLPPVATTTPTFCSQDNLSSPVLSPVIINEIAWMGSASSSADEWIELKNVSTSTVSLDNWQVIGRNTQSNENNIEISFSGQDLLAAGFSLLERTDDNSVSDISADKIFTGSINDSDFVLRLFDQNCALIDEVIATTVWQAGQKTPEPKTMERADNLTWQTSFATSSANGLFGTPKAENSQAPADERQQEQEEAEISTMEIVINEIAWMGTGVNNSSDEWLEIYNNIAVPVDLTGWKILKNGQDFIELSSSTISGSSFYLLERTDNNTTDVIEDQIYTGSLSNGGEKLELRNASNTLIDLVDFSSGWPAGTTSPGYISMERINPNATGTDSANWANNNLITRNGRDADGNRINGTPKYQNSVSKAETYVSEMPFDDFPEVILTYLGSPYLIQGNLTVPVEATLNIEPGVILKFHGSRESDYNNGDLIARGKILAQGSESKNIIFTSDSEVHGGTGWWGQIYFAPSSQNSSFNYSQFKYAGKKSADAYAMIIDATSVDIKNSILEPINQSGIKMVDSSSTLDNVIVQNAPSGMAMDISGGIPTIKNSNFKNTYSGVFVKDGSAAQFDKNNFEEISYLSGPIVIQDSYPVFSNNTATNNALNGIYLLGTINQNWTMAKDLPYLIANLKIAENIILTIDPEVIIKFLTDGKLEVYGALKAEGNSNVFTSILDDEFGGDTNNDADSSVPGSNSWAQIFFAPSSQNSIIQNSLISHGGRGGNGAVYVQGSAVELKNNTFKNNGSGYYSLLMENSPSSTVENSVFENCNVAIKIIDSCPQIQSLNFTDCMYNYYRQFDGQSLVSTSTDSSSVCSP